jgi:phage FluMu protein Com
MMIPIDGKKCAECEGIVCRAELEAWIAKGKTTCPSCSIDNATFKELKPRDLKALNTL